jgi:hypothetical protein
MNLVVRSCCKKLNLEMCRKEAIYLTRRTQGYGNEVSSVFVGGSNTRTHDHLKNQTLVQPIGRLSSVFGTLAEDWKDIGKAGMPPGGRNAG